MKEIGRLLRDADPVAREPAMPAADVQAVRRVVLAALDRHERSTSRWPGPLLATAAIATALVAGVVVGRQTPLPGTSITDPVSTGTADAVRVQRQLQFASPGGTRIIWVFDPEFNP